MGYEDSRWCITLTLGRTLEIERAAVWLGEHQGHRKVVDMLTGPFDTPEDILSTIIELVEHAEWHGEQLTLPGVPAEQ